MELIPSPKTNPEVMEFLADYGQRFLGKTTVVCKDTPAFIANRIGVYSIMSLFHNVAVMNELDLNPDIVNVNGGAIALGHPLGCSGAKLSVQLINEMRKRKQKYGMVTMCVGSGQGAAGIFEFLK